MDRERGGGGLGRCRIRAEEGGFFFYFFDLVPVPQVCAGGVVGEGFGACELVVGRGRGDDVALAGDLAGEAGDGAGHCGGLVGWVNGVSTAVGGGGGEERLGRKEGNEGHLGRFR